MALRTADDGTGAALAAAGFLLLASAATLAGCVQQREPGPAGGAARLEAKEGFFFNGDREQASLAYGAPNSDAVDFMLACTPGSRRVDITDVTHAREGQMLALTSGSDAIELPIKVVADQAAGDQIAVANGPTDLRPLRTFRQTGRITVTLKPARPMALTASTPEQAEIARFFAVCERK